MRAPIEISRSTKKRRLSNIFSCTSTVPLLCSRLGVDPTLATGPFITTTNDVLGLMVYLAIAHRATLRRAWLPTLLAVLIGLRERWLGGARAALT